MEREITWIWGVRVEKRVGYGGLKREWDMEKEGETKEEEGGEKGGYNINQARFFCVEKMFLYFFIGHTKN